MAESSLSKFMEENFSIPVMLYLTDATDEDIRYGQNILNLLTKENELLFHLKEQSPGKLGEFGLVFHINNGNLFVQNASVLNPTKTILIGSARSNHLTDEFLINFEKVINQVKLWQLYRYAQRINRAEDDTHFVKAWLYTARKGKDPFNRLPDGFHQTDAKGAQQISVDDCARFEVFTPKDMYMVLVCNDENGHIAPCDESRTGPTGIMSKNSWRWYFSPKNADRIHQEQFFFVSKDPISMTNFAFMSQEGFKSADRGKRNHLIELTKAVFDNITSYTPERIASDEWRIFCAPQVFVETAPIVDAQGDRPSQFKNRIQ